MSTLWHIPSSTGFLVSLEMFYRRFPFPTKFDIWWFFVNLSNASRFSEILQEQWVLYIKTYVNLWQYIAELFLKLEVIHTKVVEKINTHFTFNDIFRESWRLRNDVERYSKAGEATDENILRPMSFKCWISKATNTHSLYVILVSFSRRQWLRQCVSVLRYTHIFPRL
jgi:hypothetical protein